MSQQRLINISGADKDNTPLSGELPRDNDNAFDIINVSAMLWRGKWIMLIFALIFGSIGWFYANHVATPFYTATSRLAFQIRSQQVVDVESVLSGVDTDQVAINTELEVIKSRRIIEKLVDDLNLTADTEFNGLGSPSPYSRDALRWAWIKWRTGALPQHTVPPPQTLHLRTTLSVRGSIQVRAIRSTYLFDILVTTKSRTKSAEIANALAQIYIDDQVAVKFEATEYATNWLTERVADLETDLEKQETQIKDFREHTELINAESLGLLSVRFKDLRERLEGATRDLVTAKTRHEQIKSLLETGNILKAISTLNDPTLSRLNRQILANDPKAQQEALARLQSMQDAAAANLARAESQEEALHSSHDKLQEQISQQNNDLSQLTQMTRERDATSVLYETILARLKETSVQIGLQQPDSRVLSSAVSGSPVAPRKLKIQATAVIFGLFAGFSFLFLRQFLNDSFRTQDELERATNIPVLGQIPKLPLSQRSNLLPYMAENSTSAAAEAIRNLRTSILLSNVDTPPKVIMSTSSVPGEGKTTIAISLAGNLAGLGKRVLLLEGDIRRRTLNEYFSSEKVTGSLLKVMAGEASFEEAIFHNDTLGIDILLGAKTKVNSADYLSSDRFKQLIQNLREHYDYIIIDTPPVLVVPDARVVGGLADAVLYAVLWDHTKRMQVQEGLKQLSSVGVKVNGLILSRVDPRGMKRYGYGDYHGAYSQYGSSYYDRS